MYYFLNNFLETFIGWYLRQKQVFSIRTQFLWKFLPYPEVESRKRLCNHMLAFLSWYCIIRLTLVWNNHQNMNFVDERWSSDIVDLLGGSFIGFLIICLSRAALVLIKSKKRMKLIFLENQQKFHFFKYGWKNVSFCTKMVSR